MAKTIKRALVTGGCGFIGSHLVERLVNEGAEVSVLDDLSTGKVENVGGVVDRIQFVQGSILNPADVRAAAAGCDTIFHMAALVSVAASVDDPLGSERINVEGTLHVLEAARAQNSKVVFSSSAAVYGNAEALPVRESNPLLPLSPYAIQKLTGEMYCRAYHHLFGLESVCLRYFNVYGPRQDPSSPYSGVISIFVSRANEGQAITIFGDGSQTRDFIYVQDVVSANVRAAASSTVDGRAFNIGTGRETSVLELASSTRDLLGSSSDIAFAEPRAGDILKSVCDPSSADSALGFRAETQLDEGLTKTVNA